MAAIGSLGFSAHSTTGFGQDPSECGAPLSDLPLHGAEALLREVLVDAIRIYCRAIALGGTWTPEYREAKRWLFDEKSRSLMSFAVICEIFALSTVGLRRSLRRFPFEPDPRLLRISRLVDGAETADGRADVRRSA